MKIFAAPKHLSNAIAPLMTMNYLAGLRIFEHPRGKLHTLPSLIYFLLLFGTFCVCIHAQYRFYKHIQLLKLEYVLYEFMVYACAFITTFVMVLGYFYTKTINACYRKIVQIDETLRQLGSMINHGKIYYLSIVAVITCFLYIFISAIVTMIIQMRADLSTVIFVVAAQMHIINISFTVISEFSILVKCLRIRFELINELLRKNAAVSTMEGMKLDLFATEDYAKIADSKQRQNILSIKVLSQLNRQLQTRIRTFVPGKHNLVKSQTRSRLSSQLQKQLQIELENQSRNQTENSNSARRLIMIAECRRRTHLLQTIRQVHLELCRVSKTLCTSFGVQITSEIGISIILITLFLYNLYILFIHRRQKAAGHCLIDESFVVIILVITNLLKIVVISRACKHATNEGKKTSEIIHEIYRCCPDADIREEIQQFGLQLSLNPVEFFTFGIFLNYQVLSSCLKTVTTYMVIMIQVSNSLESSKNN